MPHKLTPDQQEKIKELYRAGYATIDIAARFGVRKNTVTRLASVPRTKASKSADKR